MPSLPFTASYTPQDYQPIYVKIDNRLQTEVQSINLVRTDGGADIGTTVKDYAGRIKGICKADLTLKGVVPYILTDASGGGGVGFSSAGIVTGGGIQLDATMLSGQNQNSNFPVSVIIMLGNPAAQKLVFTGFIHMFTVDYADGKQIDFTAQASGTYSLFHSA